MRYLVLTLLCLGAYLPSSKSSKIEENLKVQFTEKGTAYIQSSTAHIGIQADIESFYDKALGVLKEFKDWHDGDSYNDDKDSHYYEHYR